jgi:hypothetical protein
MKEGPVLRRLRNHLETIVVAMITAAVTAAAPALAHGVQHALFAHNADKVDGKHAVGAGATIEARRGKLVATSRTTGRLPDDIIAMAPNSDRLDGKNSSDFLRAGQIRMSHNGPWSVVKFGLSDGTVRQYQGAVRIESTNGQLAWAMLHLVGPVTIGPTNYALKSVRVCLLVSEGEKVDGTAIYDQSNLLINEVFEDPTDRTASVFPPECYSVVPPTPIVPQGSLALTLKFDANAIGDFLDIGSVEATWAPVP